MSSDSKPRRASSFKWAAGILAVVLVLFGALSVYRSQSSLVPPHTAATLFTPSETQKDAQYAEADGVMRAQDYLKLSQIGDTVLKTGSISDVDLAWSLRLMHSKPLRDDQGTMLRSDVVANLRYLRHITPSQQDSMYKAAIPMMASSEWFDKYRSAQLLGIIKDKRAVPYLRPLLKYPNNKVQISAQKALNKIEQS